MAFKYKDLEHARRRLQVSQADAQTLIAIGALRQVNGHLVLDLGRYNGWRVSLHHPPISVSYGGTTIAIGRRFSGSPLGRAAKVSKKRRRPAALGKQAHHSAASKAGKSNKRQKRRRDAYIAWSQIVAADDRVAQPAPKPETGQRRVYGNPSDSPCVTDTTPDLARDELERGLEKRRM